MRKRFLFVAVFVLLAFVRSVAAQSPSADPCVMAVKPMMLTWADACTAYTYFAMGGGIEYLNAAHTVAPILDDVKNPGANPDDYGFILKDGYRMWFDVQSNVHAQKGQSFVVSIDVQFFGADGKRMKANYERSNHTISPSFGITFYLFNTPRGSFGFSLPDSLVKTGWIQISMSRNENGDAGGHIAPILQLMKGGKVVEELPIDTGFATRDFNVPCQVDLSQSSNCGISLANPGTQIATVKVTARDPSGKEIVASLVLPSQEERAKMLSDILPFPEVWGSGTMVNFSSDAPILLFAVQASMKTGDDGVSKSNMRVIYPPARDVPNTQQ